MRTIYGELVINLSSLFVSLGFGLVIFEVMLLIFIKRIKSVSVGDALLVKYDHRIV